MSLPEEPLFLTKEQVLAYHRQQIALFGGSGGLGDEGLFESALVQPQTTWCYDATADLFDLAATYAFHLAKNHAFEDGNKRVALEAAVGFLGVNGVTLDVSQEALFDTMIALVTSVIDKRKFASFLRAHHSA